MDDDGDGCIMLKANSCHSIRHVRPVNEYIPPNDYSMGYIFLKHNEKYIPGDVYPSHGRNDIIVRFATRRPTGHHLLVDLSGLYNANIKIFKVDNTGVCIRGILPKEFYNYIPRYSDGRIRKMKNREKFVKFGDLKKAFDLVRHGREAQGAPLGPGPLKHLDQRREAGAVNISDFLKIDHDLFPGFLLKQFPEIRRGADIDLAVHLKNSYTVLLV